MKRTTVLAVRDETHRAQQKHDSSIEQRDSQDRIANILTEEVGEVAEAMMNYVDYPSIETLVHLKAELIQVMSVASRWYESLPLLELPN